MPDSSRPRDILRHYIGDLVYGASDGLITTFAIVSGVAGANLHPRVLVILGLVNLAADGFSMGASNYLAIRSEAEAHAERRGRIEPLLHAIATFSAFVIAGGLPLLAWILPLDPEISFGTASVIGAVALFLIGAARHSVTGEGALRSGSEMLTIGAVAALVAFGAGRALDRLIG